MKISKGFHVSREQGMCAMETVAWLAGEKHSDCPRCVHPLISNFVRTWNDGLLDYERDDIMIPLIPMLIGTYQKGAGDIIRLAYDWLMKDFPRFYENGSHCANGEELDRCAFYAALRVYSGCNFRFSKRLVPIREIQMSASDLVERMCNAIPNYTQKGKSCLNCFGRWLSYPGRERWQWNEFLLEHRDVLTDDEYVTAMRWLSVGTAVLDNFFIGLDPELK